MPNYRRDAVLAAVALAVLLGLLVVDRTTGTLLGPVPAVSGVLGALLIELGFLRYPAITGLWERPAVQFGSVVAVVAGGTWAYGIVGPPVVAVLCWGLLTYFLLLGAVLAVGHDPLAAVE
jgi:hypothetical protein